MEKGFDSFTLIGGTGAICELINDIMRGRDGRMSHYPCANDDAGSTTQILVGCGTTCRQAWEEC